MEYFAGLDVSVKDTSVCIVDDTGKIVREVKVASEPEALLTVLRNAAYHFKRIGLEAGPLSQWLFSALAEADLPVICVETRHMRAVLKAQINKTDRNGARGMAQMMRVGLYRAVHVKTLRSQKLRMLLTHRKLLQSKAIAVDNDLRGTLRNFGLKVGIVGAAKFEARIRELIGGFSRPGSTDRTAAGCPPGATRAGRHSASALAGHCPGRRGMPALDDGSGRGSSSSADLSGYSGRAGPLSEVKVCRSCLWIDAL
jgi:transposase